MNTITKEAEEKERQATFNATLGRIGSAWGRAGTGVDLPTLTDKLPAEDALLEAAQRRLNRTWLSCQVNMASPAEFQAALDAWETQNYNAITALKAVL